MKRVLAVLALAAMCSAGVLVSAPSAGALNRVNTRFEGVSHSFPFAGAIQFDGRIVTRAKCRANRTIVASGPTGVVGSDSTDSDGVFGIAGSSQGAGTYVLVAKVARRGNTVCRKAVFSEVV